MHAYMSSQRTGNQKLNSTWVVNSLMDKTVHTAEPSDKYGDYHNM